eukprot:scaffold20.g7604.t1
MEFEAVLEQLGAPFAGEAANAAGVMWAKVNRYPHWPAQVLPGGCPELERLRQEDPAPPPGKTIGVMFFGDCTLAWQAPSDLVPFGMGVARGFLQPKRGGQPLRHALAQTAMFLHPTEPRVAPDSWWCRAPPVHTRLPPSLAVPRPAAVLPPAPLAVAPAAPNRQTAALLQQPQPAQQPQLPQPMHVDVPQAQAQQQWDQLAAPVAPAALKLPVQQPSAKKKKKAAPKAAGGPASPKLAHAAGGEAGSPLSPDQPKKKRPAPGSAAAAAAAAGAGGPQAEVELSGFLESLVDPGGVNFQEHKELMGFAFQSLQARAGCPRARGARACMPRVPGARLPPCLRAHPRRRLAPPRVQGKRDVLGPRFQEAVDVLKQYRCKRGRRELKYNRPNERHRSVKSVTEHILAELGVEQATVGRQHFQAVKAAGRSPGGGGSGAKRPRRPRPPKARDSKGGDADEDGDPMGVGLPPVYPPYDSEGEGEEENEEEGGRWGSEGSWEGEQPLFDGEAEGAWDEAGGALAAHQGSGGSAAGATTASVRDMLRQLLNRLKLLHPTIARVDTPSQTHDLVAVAHKFFGAALPCDMHSLVGGRGQPLKGKDCYDCLAAIFSWAAGAEVTPAQAKACFPVAPHGRVLAPRVSWDAIKQLGLHPLHWRLPLNEAQVAQGQRDGAAGVPPPLEPPPCKPILPPGAAPPRPPGRRPGSSAADGGQQQRVKRPPAAKGSPYDPSAAAAPRRRGAGASSSSGTPAEGGTAHAPAPSLGPVLPIRDGRIHKPKGWAAAMAAATAPANSGSAAEAAEVMRRNSLPSYTHIRQNVWISRPRPKRHQRDEIPVCNCRPPPLSQAMQAAMAAAAAAAAEPLPPLTTRAAAAAAAVCPAGTEEDGGEAMDVDGPLQEERADEADWDSPAAVAAAVTAAAFAPHMAVDGPVGLEGLVVRRLVASMLARAEAAASTEELQAQEGQEEEEATAPQAEPGPGEVTPLPHPALAAVKAASSGGTNGGLERTGSGMSGGSAIGMRSTRAAAVAAAAAAAAGSDDEAQGGQEGVERWWGCSKGCLNRLSFIHCDPRTCPCGERCSNQPFASLPHPPMEVFLTLDKGWGVRAAGHIRKGTFVVEYAGEVIDDRESERRMQEAKARSEPHFYMMEMAPGKLAAHAACSSQPALSKWHDAANGEVRVGIFALRDIRPGEELVYDYQFQQRGLAAAAGAYRCNCGAANCRGTMDTQPERMRDFGRRLEVWWPGEKRWYAGTVAGYAAAAQRHTVKYDDGDTRREYLPGERHRWLDTGGNQAGPVQEPDPNARAPSRPGAQRPGKRSAAEWAAAVLDQPAKRQRAPAEPLPAEVALAAGAAAQRAAQLAKQLPAAAKQEEEQPTGLAVGALPMQAGLGNLAIAPLNLLAPGPGAELSIAPLDLSLGAVPSLPGPAVAALAVPPLPGPGAAPGFPIASLSLPPVGQQLPIFPLSLPHNSEHNSEPSAAQAAPPAAGIAQPQPGGEVAMDFLASGDQAQQVEVGAAVEAAQHEAALVPVGQLQQQAEEPALGPAPAAQQAALPEPTAALLAGQGEEPPAPPAPALGGGPADERPVSGTIGHRRGKGGNAVADAEEEEHEEAQEEGGLAATRPRRQSRKPSARYGDDFETGGVELAPPAPEPSSPPRRMVETSKARAFHAAALSPASHAAAHTIAGLFGAAAAQAAASTPGSALKKAGGEAHGNGAPAIGEALQQLQATAGVGGALASARAAQRKPAGGSSGSRPAGRRVSGPGPASTGLPARTILVAKKLTNSDVSKGRILLPRAAVEANLSFAIGRAHSVAAHDHTGREWEFTLQSWANGMESRRVYVLEHAGDFLRAHGLRPEDVIGLSTTTEGTFLVEYNTDEVVTASENLAGMRPGLVTPAVVALPPGLVAAQEGMPAQQQQQQLAGGHSEGSAKAAGHPAVTPTPATRKGRGDAAISGGSVSKAVSAGGSTKRGAEAGGIGPQLQSDGGRPKRQRRPTEKAAALAEAASEGDLEAATEAAEAADSDYDASRATPSPSSSPSPARQQPPPPPAAAPPAPAVAVSAALVRPALAPPAAAAPPAVRPVLPQALPKPAAPHQVPPIFVMASEGHPSPQMPPHARSPLRPSLSRGQLIPAGSGSLPPTVPAQAASAPPGSVVTGLPSPVAAVTLPPLPMLAAQPPLLAQQQQPAQQQSTPAPGAPHHEVHQWLASSSPEADAAGRARTVQRQPQPRQQQQAAPLHPKSVPHASLAGVLAALPALPAQLPAVPHPPLFGAPAPPPAVPALVAPAPGVHHDPHEFDPTHFLV